MRRSAAICLGASLGLLGWTTTGAHACDERYPLTCLTAEVTLPKEVPMPRVRPEKKAQRTAAARKPARPKPAAPATAREASAAPSTPEQPEPAPAARPRRAAAPAASPAAAPAPSATAGEPSPWANVPTNGSGSTPAAASIPQSPPQQPRITPVRGTPVRASAPPPTPAAEPQPAPAVAGQSDNALRNALTLRAMQLRAKSQDDTGEGAPQR